MPSRRKQLRGRRGWSDEHLIQLACSHDWHRMAWGNLSELPDSELRTAISEMSDCWREHGATLTRESAGLNPSDKPIWFSQYADDTDRLFRECHKARSYMEYQRANNGYRPYEEFEAQYTPTHGE